MSWIFLTWASWVWCSGGRKGLHCGTLQKPQMFLDIRCFPAGINPVLPSGVHRLLRNAGMELPAHCIPRAEWTAGEQFGKWETMRLCRGCKAQTNLYHRSFNNLRQGIIVNHMKKAFIKAVLKIYFSELYDFPCHPHAFHEETTEGWRWNHTSSGCPEIPSQEFLGQPLLSGGSSYIYFL